MLAAKEHRHREDLIVTMSLPQSGIFSPRRTSIEGTIDWAMMPSQGELLRKQVASAAGQKPSVALSFLCEVNSLERIKERGGACCSFSERRPVWTRQWKEDMKDRVGMLRRGGKFENLQVQSFCEVKGLGVSLPSKVCFETGRWKTDWCAEPLHKRCQKYVCQTSKRSLLEKMGQEA